MEDGNEAAAHIAGVREYRKELASPLHDPNSTTEEQSQALQELRTFRELNHQDPDYRQSLRILSELRAQRPINNPKIETPLVAGKHEFPSDPEDRYEAILSSITNHAGKQITLLSIPSIPGTIITGKELHRAFLQNSGGVWKTADRIQTEHAKKSLIPIGMVAEEVGFKKGLQEETVGFTQTQAGKEYGDPIAKFLLKYAADNNLSLEKIFGTTLSKTESRAPYNRARILEYLAERKNDSGIRIVDITGIFGFSDNVVSAALTSLQEEGLVMFDSVSAESSKVKFNYSVNPDFNQVPRSTHGYNIRPALEAISSLVNNGVSEFSIDTVLAEVQKKDPTCERRVIRNLVLDLARGGYLNRGEFKGSANLSVVTILQEGEKFVKEVLEPLRLSLTDTPEGEALRNVWRSIPWNDYAPKALERHKELSKKGNPVSGSVSLEKINEIILENPGIRTGEIKRKLKESDLPYKTINMYINKLVESGNIKKVRESNVLTRWFPIEKGAADEPISS